MFELFGRMMFLPVTVFVSTTRQVLTSVEHWMPPGGVPAGLDPAGGWGQEPRRRGWETRPGAPQADPAIEPKEEWNVADTNLNDNDIKLIEYAIINTERRKERILDRAANADGTLGMPLLYLETDRVTGDGFSNARIADWVKKNPEEAKDMDLGALRVYYNVVARWPEGDLRYEERQLDIEEEKLGYLRKLAGA